MRKDFDLIYKIIFFQTRRTRRIDAELVELTGTLRGALTDGPALAQKLTDLAPVAGRNYCNYPARARAHLGTDFDFPRQVVGCVE